MGYGYLVSSIGPQPSYITDPQEFIAHFKERWLDAEIRLLPQSDSYALRWRIQIAEFPSLGGLQRNSNCISIDAVRDHLDAAEIAVWYRTIVPAEVELYFYTGPRWQSPVKIEPTTTAQEIVEKFLSTE